MDSAVQEALAALKANPPHDNNPLPWHFAETDDQGCDVISAFDVHVASECYYKSAAHIAAAVNAAPVLAAEVERLQGLLAAARWKVEQLPRYEEHMCTIEVLGANDLDLANEALDRARRAVGLEESHG
jgi:hypothetical protein